MHCGRICGSNKRGSSLRVCSPWRLRRRTSIFPVDCVIKNGPIVPVFVPGKLRLRQIPSSMFRHFPTARAPGNFPLKMTHWAIPRCRKRVPKMTALALPPKVCKRPEKALRTTNESAIGTSHCGATGFVAMHFSQRTRVHNPSALEQRVRWARSLHLRNRRRRNASQGGSKFDGCEQTKIVVWDLLKRSTVFWSRLLNRKLSFEVRRTQGTR